MTLTPCLLGTHVLIVSSILTFSWIVISVQHARAFDLLPTNHLCYKDHGLKLDQIPCLGILVTTHMIYPLVVGLEFVIVTGF